MTNGPPRHASMRMTQSYRADFECLLDSLLDERAAPFAFARFGDGELAIIEGRAVASCDDGWASREACSPLGEALRDAVSSDVDGLYLGISCHCCALSDHVAYTGLVTAPLERVTYANLLVNGNFRPFRDALVGADALARFATVGSHPGADVRVPADAISGGWDWKPALERMLTATQPLLVAAGPVGSVLVHRYWCDAGATRRTCVDIGSTMDEPWKGRISRAYQNPHHPYSYRRCTWPSPGHAPGLSRTRRILRDAREQALASWAKLMDRVPVARRSSG